MQQQHAATPTNDAGEKQSGEGWFYLIGEEHFGPISTDNLRKAITSGQLSKETHVFREGLSDWLRASQCQELCATPEVKLPPVPSASISTPTSDRRWVLWWPQSLIGNLLFSSLIAWLVLIYLRWGDPLRGFNAFVALYVLFLFGRFLTSFVRNRIVGLPRFSFSSPRTLLQSPQVRRGTSLGVFGASLVFALWTTNQLQQLNVHKRELLSAASEAQGRLEHMNSGEYKQNLLAEGVLRAAAGDEDGIKNRMAQENQKLESSMERAKDLTWDLRAMTEQLESLKVSRLYSVVLGGLSLLCCILAFVLPSRRSASMA